MVVVGSGCGCGCVEGGMWVSACSVLMLVDDVSLGSKGVVGRQTLSCASPQGDGLAVPQQNLHASRC